MSLQVALVLDADFADKLKEIALKMPVWVIQTTKNSATVRRLRRQYPKLELTEFFKDNSECNCEIFYRIISSLDDHYNEYSQELPYKSLLVFGLDLDLVDTTVLNELNFHIFYKTEYGFIAEKADGKLSSGNSSHYSES